MTPSNLSTRLLTVAAFTLANSVATAQSTWFVDAAAAGPGDGTSADPFPTIQQAIDDVDTVDGDTVSVAPGTYSEWVRYGNKRITIQSQGGPLVTTIVPPASTGEFVVRMSTASGLVGAVLEGFTVSGLPGVDSSGVWGAGGRVVRCILRDHRSAAPGISYGAFSNFDLFLEECTIVGNEGGVHPGIFFLLMYATNTAIHGNDTDIGPDGDPTNLLISYSSWGQDNGFPYGPTNLIGQDPGFWKEDGEDLHLAPGSPLIDAGNPAAPGGRGRVDDRHRCPDLRSRLHPRAAHLLHVEALERFMLAEDRRDRNSGLQRSGFVHDHRGQRLGVEDRPVLLRAR